MGIPVEFVKELPFAHGLLPILLLFSLRTVIENLVFSGIFCYSTWILIWILIGVFTYRDAVRRGKNGIFWFVMVFALQLVGLLIWFIARPPKQVMKLKDGK
jgi:hypothetical protein